MNTMYCIFAVRCKKTQNMRFSENSPWKTFFAKLKMDILKMSIFYFVKKVFQGVFSEKRISRIFIIILQIGSTLYSL